jgi:competence protein ComEA
MDAPAPLPPAPGPAGTPALPPAAPAASLDQPRSAQLAVGVFLLLALGLLAYRGYGHGLNTRPTEQVRAASLDVNAADRTALEQVPGIGPSLARQIADHRRDSGPFRSLDELRNVKGVGAATLAKVRPYLYVDPSSLPPPTTEARPEPLVLERKTPPKPSGGGKKFQPGEPPIDVNSVGVEQLARLPGIGPATAQKIIAARNERPFRTLADLDRVKGIGPKKLEAIRPFVVFE